MSMIQNQNTLRCAIYIRVSTEEQNLHGLSLPAQKKALTEYAQSNRLQIVDYYADEGISARKPMKHRKNLLRLLEDVKQNKIDMILVTKLDRWFRNIRDYNITEEILKKHNCHWKTIFEHYDSSTANGQMVINIMLSVNQAECDRTSERIRSVMEYKRSIGEITSGRCACFGYRAENKKLVKDKAVSDLIDDAYAHYFNCFSIHSTVRYITEKYSPNSPSPYKIEQLFKKETYAGRNRENDHYCEPYLTPDQWFLVRKATASRQNLTAGSPYLFSSLIKCPFCGCNYTGYRKKRKRGDGSEHITIKYRCGRKYNRHCAPHVTEHLLEAFLLEQFSPCLTREITISLPDAALPSSKTASNICDERNRLNLLFQKGRIAESYYEEQYGILTQALDKQKLSAFFPSFVKVPQVFQGDFLALYRSLNKAHQQTFWKTFVDHIDIGQTAPLTYYPKLF